MLLCAPPCSSWTRVSRGTTWRTRMNPMGLCYDFVAAGNLVISRRLVLICFWGPFLCTLCMCRCGSLNQWLFLDWFKNRLAARPRLACLLLIAEARHSCWLIEQPVGSTDTLPYHPRLDWLFNHVIYATCHIICDNVMHTIELSRCSGIKK